MGDFIPQTPSLGTSPQTPSSLRAVLSDLTYSAHAHCTLSLFNPPRSEAEGQGNSVPLWGLGQSPNHPPFSPP